MTPYSSVDYEARLVAQGLFNLEVHRLRKVLIRIYEHATNQKNCYSQPLVDMANEALTGEVVDA